MMKYVFFFLGFLINATDSLSSKGEDESRCYTRAASSIPKDVAFKKPSPIGRVHRGEVKFDSKRGLYYTGQILDEFPQKEEKKKVVLESH